MVDTELPIPNTVCTPVRADGTILGGIFALLLCNGIRASVVCFYRPRSQPVLVAMFYMFYFTFRKYRTFNNSLIIMFHRDGIFYFVSLSGELFQSRI
jgi:hypothetical protein